MGYMEGNNNKWVDVDCAVGKHAAGHNNLMEYVLLKRELKGLGAHTKKKEI